MYTRLENDKRYGIGMYYKTDKKWFIGKWEDDKSNWSFINY
jgi:hypothetical protein